MAPLVQGLGHLDSSLIVDDESFLSDFENKRNSIDESIKLTERFTLSYLWVLGSYELVRSICQRIGENRVVVSDETAQRFRELKKEFNRLRVPLAKMEPASVHKNTDSHIAFPALDPQKGIAWQVSEDVFVTRRDLADRLLAVLEFTWGNDPNLSSQGCDGAQSDVQADVHEKP